MEVPRWKCGITYKLFWDFGSSHTPFINEDCRLGPGERISSPVLVFFRNEEFVNDRRCRRSSVLLIMSMGELLSIIWLICLKQSHSNYFTDFRRIVAIANNPNVAAQIAAQIATNALPIPFLFSAALNKANQMNTPKLRIAPMTHKKSWPAREETSRSFFRGGVIWWLRRPVSESFDVASDTLV